MLQQGLSDRIGAWLRREYGPFKVIALAVLFILVTGNQRFFVNLGAAVGDDPWAKAELMLVAAVGLFALFYLLFALLAFRRWVKPLLIFVLLVSATAGYFMNTYQVVIDQQMLRNVAETDAAEAAELLSLRMALHIGLLGILPALLLAFAKLKYLPWRAHTLRQLGMVVGSAVLLLSLVGIFFKDIFLFGREHRDLRYYANPVYPLYSLVKFVNLGTSRTAMSKEITPVGLDALRVSPRRERDKKTLVVMVLGETARASEFSLGGYGRDTNPFTEDEGVVFFDHVTACGTSTASSVPCMFSDLGHDIYSLDKARARENVLDVLQHAGVEVLWRDNNSGCKHVCDRVPHEGPPDLKSPDYCRADECYDEVLLQQLQPLFDGAQGDMLIVLHQKGSHGPAYARRHPDTFGVFQPECLKDQVQECDHAEIVNAYDNTILYTDYFLASVIELLKRNTDKFNTALLYISDHGESLGENGIYLHGMPYVIAPEDQIHVPMMTWMSDGYADAYGIDTASVGRRRSQSYSHDNLFHTLLGMFAVRSGIYSEDKDIFAACRQADAPLDLTSAHASSLHPQAAPGND